MKVDLEQHLGSVVMAVMAEHFVWRLRLFQSKVNLATHTETAEHVAVKAQL